MFDVQNISLSFGGRQILRDASFKVEDGERCAIIGPNGTGKSTLIKIIAGEVKAEGGTIAYPKNTEIGYLPQHLELHSDLSVLEECRTVYQDVLDHEKEMRDLEHRMAEVDPESEEFEQIGERYEFLMHETQRRDLYSMDATIAKVLDGLGFSGKDKARPCSQFSGGWQMRILLAKLLLQNPDVLLLDEPTNHLDIESIEWLGSWIKTHEGSVLMVSHERAFMDALVTKVVEIERANVVMYRGNYTEAQEMRKERREMQQRTYENNVRERAHIQQFIDRFRYQASKAALVQSRVKQLEKMEEVEAPEADQGTISFRFPPAPRCGKEVIVAEGIRKAYGKQVVLGGVDFTLYRGEKVALVGHNGAGKTTLMRILAGRDDRYEGGVALGSNVDMAYFAQYDAEDLHPDNSVFKEFIATAPLEVSDKARGILGAFLFSGDEAVNKPVKVLSGGERTRLRLAKMLCGRANLLLMDEPTNHLDIGSRLTLEEALRQYDGAVVLVSHDRYFLDNVVTRVVEVSNGKLTSYPGNYADYLAMKEMQEAKAVGKASPATASNGAAQQADGAAPKDDHKESPGERRERQERQKAAKNRLRKAEKEKEELEIALERSQREVAALENQMAKPEVATDFEQVNALTAKLQAARNREAQFEERWLALEMELEELAGLLEAAP